MGRQHPTTKVIPLREKTDALQASRISHVIVSDMYSMVADFETPSMFPHMCDVKGRKVVERT